MGQKTILVVDDDPVIHHLLAGVFRNRGWVVESAYDGLQAWAKLETNGHYDLVLTDVRMPGLDGLELLRRIRKGHPRTKVVVITGAGTPEDVITAIRDQAYTYFSKPVSPAAVADLIEQALESPGGDDDIQVISARPEWISLLVRCRLEVADRLVQFLRDADVDVSDNERDNIATAFRELLLNAIEHGGKSNPEKTIRVSYVRTRRVMLYYIHDPGEGFSFDQLAHAAVTQPGVPPLEHATVRDEQGLRPGGFGILLARNLADEVIYSQKGNEVLLIKYLQ